MSLRLIYGRAGSGKTYYCLNELKERVEGGLSHPMVLLVPEQFTLQAERDLINVLGTGGLLNTEVLSFRRMAFRIFSEAGGITYPHIHPAGKCMIIYRILDKMGENLPVFEQSAGRRGFVNTLADLITEFKRYNVKPDDLELAGRNLEDSLLKDKLTEIKAIYLRFEQDIAQKYRDTDDDLTLASEKLAGCTLYQGAEIWIDGFAGFTPQEYGMIAQLFCKAERITISLCTDSLEDTAGTDIFSSVKDVGRRIRRIAKETGNKEDPPVKLESESLFRFKNSPELAHLERYVYTFPHKIYDNETRDIVLNFSLNIFSEIEEAARDIISLCRDRGMRYRDIAVVTGNLTEYERLIEVVFAQYNIPCFLDRKVEIINHPLVRLILSMLDIFIDNWSYEAVFSYLKTGLTGLDRNDADVLENYVLACGIRGSCWTSDNYWDMRPGLLPGESDSAKLKDQLEKINRIRFQVTRGLLEFRRKTRGRRKAAEICDALYDFLCTEGIPVRIEKQAEELRKKGKLSLANEYSQVWNIVMDVLDQAVEVLGDEAIGLERFSDILETGLGQYQAGLIPASLDEVLVGNIERSRSHEVKALYILGVNDGIFPSSLQEEGILSDSDRAALNSIGLELASDTRAKAFDQQYLVYRAFTTAGSYLRLSWPIADHDGRSLRPSLIISRLKKVFPTIKVIGNVLDPDSIAKDEMKLVAGRTPAFGQLAGAFRRKADGKDIDPLWQEVYHWFKSRQDWQEKCRLLLSACRYKNTVFPVSRASTVLLYGFPVSASVSRLERYAACPFSFYLQYGLKAKERKIYRLEPPDIGTFLHTVIERFSREVAEKDISWREIDKEWCSSKVSSIIEDMLQEMGSSGFAGSKRYTALALRLKRVAARAVCLIAEHIRLGSFEPLGYELGFGDKDKFPPIVIELESGDQIKLTGRIDRVDSLKTEGGTYLRIVDYKSGSKDLDISDVYYGLQIQLITYLDALWENGGTDIGSPVIPGGVLYFRIDDPIIRADGKKSEEEIEKAIMKKLKMKGLLLADVKLIKEMDNTIDGSSLIIPAAINKGNGLGRSSKAVSLSQFNMLRLYLRKLLKKLGEEIIGGNTAIIPYKKKNLTACKYCSYQPVCRFDPALKENSFRLLTDRKNEDIWNIIEEECKSQSKDSNIN